MANEQNKLRWRFGSRIRIATLVRRALAEVYTVSVLLVLKCFFLCYNTFRFVDAWLFYCVTFSFVSTLLIHCLWRTSLKWPIFVSRGT